MANNKTVLKTARMLIQDIEDLESIEKGLGDFMTGINRAAGKVRGAVGGAAKRGYDALTRGVSPTDASGKARTPAEMAGYGIDARVGDARQGFNRGMQRVGDMALDGALGVAEGIDRGIAGVRGAANTVGQGFVGAANTIGQGFVDAADAAKRGAAAAGGAVKTGVENAAKAAKRGATSVGTAVKDGVRAARGGLGGVVDRMGQGLSNFGQKVSGFGQKVKGDQSTAQETKSIFEYLNNKIDFYDN